MKPPSLLCFLVLLGASAAYPQELPSPPPELAKKLEQIRSAPQSQWLELAAGAMIPYLQDLIWTKAQELSRGKLFRPEISIRMDAPEPAPYTQNKKIVYPALFLARAYLAASLMSHDLYVDDGHTFPVPDPVLQRPYAVSPVQRSLPLSGLELDGPAALGLLNVLTCNGRDKQCNYFQSITISSILLFSLGHEYGHIVSGDAGRKEYDFSIDKEKAADAWGMSLMLAVAPEFASDEDRSDYFWLGPPALLWLRAATARGDATELESRKAALVALLPQAARTRYESLVNPQGRADGMSSLELRWSEPPDWVAVDGIFYPPEQLQNRKLRILSGLHYAVSVAGGKLAYAEIGAWNSNQIARLDFQPFVAGSSSPEELASLKRARKWGDILLRASTPDLKPRNDDVTLPMFEALNWTRLGRFIRPADLPATVTAAERRRVERWAKAGQPLAAWVP